MNDDQQALCDAVGRAIVARDLEGLHALLAPWLQSEMRPASIGERLDAAGEGLGHPPDSWSSDEGLASLDDLRMPDAFGPPSSGLPAQITADNFRGWLSIQLTPAEEVHEEQNVCYDVWIAAVEDGGGLRVGYFEPWEAS